MSHSGFVFWIPIENPVDVTRVSPPEGVYRYMTPDRVDVDVFACHIMYMFFVPVPLYVDEPVLHDVEVPHLT